MGYDGLANLQQQLTRVMGKLAKNLSVNNIYLIIAHLNRDKFHE